MKPDARACSQRQSFIAIAVAMLLVHFGTAVPGSAAVNSLRRLEVSSFDQSKKPANVRPIDDFIDAQGTTSLFYNSPPYTGIPDYAVGWTSPPCPGPLCEYPTSRIGVVDYTGGANRYLRRHGYRSLGTKTEGNITERLLPDGRAEVTVVLHVSNALAFVSAWDSTSTSAELNQRLFGFSVPDILKDPLHRSPALADADLIMIFRNQVLGQSMPDLVKWFNGIDGGYPDKELVLLYFNARAKGTLDSHAGLGPSGTPGKAMVMQVGVFPAQNPPIPGTNFGFVLEKVDLEKR